MVKLVVSAYSEKDDVVRVVAVNDNLQVATVCTEKVSNLVSVLSKINAEPYNFSIKDGKVVQDAGKFGRLNGNGVCIILQELQSRGGRILGYTLLQTVTNRIFRLERQELLNKANAVKYPLVQNAIISDNAVRSYSGHPFEVVRVSTKKPTTSVRSNKPLSSNTVEETKEQQMVSVPPNADKFTKKAMKLFGDASFISNPRLNDKQKNVLVRAKNKGALVEYFNNPDIPVEVMSFYGDNILSEGIAKDCKNMFNNPKLRMNQVDELYAGAIAGVDIDDLCDEKMSYMDMRNKIQTERMELWCDIDPTPPDDAELLLKCINMAQRQELYSQ